MYQEKRTHRYFLYGNIGMIILFALYFLLRFNFEIIIYVGIIILYFFIFYATRHKIAYPNYVLFGLTLWSFMHMAGGAFYVGGQRLYQIVIIPLVGAPFYIIRYDQIVHFVGFGVTTLLLFFLIKPLINNIQNHKLFLLFILVFSSIGLGSLNEIGEFFIVSSFSAADIGGFYNTSLDMVANFIGALLAAVFLYFKELR